MSRHQTSTTTALRLLIAADAFDHPRNTYDDQAAYDADQEDVATIRKAASILDFWVDEGNPFNPDTCLDGEEE